MTKTNDKNKILAMARIYMTPLKRFLLELDLTQKELAQALNVAQSRISMMAAGASVPSLQLAEDMTVYFQKQGFEAITELVFLYPHRYMQGVEFKKSFKNNTK